MVVDGRVLIEVEVTDVAEVKLTVDPPVVPPGAIVKGLGPVVFWQAASDKQIIRRAAVFFNGFPPF